ncbi:MAG: serine/threonine protein kinase [Deltaproteobacteria bacterium]|nr:serine/threonine protein kinase [Deltaproteobacteria bacterium]MDQ3298416.1 serine/threonine protein kinase [Myxococcota bacterium]
MHEDDATLPGSLAATTEPTSAVEVDSRYELGPVIGRGGMGEVRLARDLRIDREVAVKLMRHAASDREHVARFFREARVQGALEHPAVVPVHDLGIDREGNPYFVMKRLAGTTLADVLAERSSSDAHHPKWPRRLLLTRLVDVSLAIEFAHTRGVVHRDLKPANIMLGDFGEAYVLDWGLARIVSDSASIAMVNRVSGDHEAGHTAVGTLLGTPGYMAPEQARGEDIDARADVFGLGCVLYEILTGIPALPRGIAAITATLESVEQRPSKRIGDIPPELDDLCARATAHDRARRPTARQLAEAIQAYLDGDRDVERRRELALTHVVKAQQALLSIDDEARATAMREAGRAFALDPTSTTAHDLLARLVLTPPATIPAEALAAADHERASGLQHALRFAMLPYVGIFLGVVLLLSLPVRHAWPIVSAMVLAAATVAALWAVSRRVVSLRSRWYLLIVVLNTLLLVSGSFIFGPLLIVPIFLVGTLAGFLAVPVRFHPALIVTSQVLAIAVPIVSELVGLTASTFSFEPGQIVLTPYALDLPPSATAGVLVLAMVSQFTNTTIVALNQRNSQQDALDRVYAQKWHVEQLLPQTSRSQLPAPLEPGACRDPALSSRTLTP